MPRSGGKRIKNRNRGLAKVSDVTLNDFANSDVLPGKGRLKKGTQNTMVKEVKELCTASTSSNIKPITLPSAEKDWFDMTLDEFGIDSAPEEEDESEIYNRRTTSTRTRRRRKTTSISAIEDDTGVMYPLDIWFIIGAYIKPEDVSTFAQLCKSAYAVTLTSKFWYRLYRRYYKPVANLPVRLQPECMERLFGLRSCVIRSLYYFYPSFQERIQKNRIGTYVSGKTKQEEPDSLLRRPCIMMWHQKGRGVYHYFFKLLEYNEDEYLRHRGRQPDLIEMLGDINANPEKGCKVLQVTTKSFNALPPTILGHTLLSASSVLSSDFRSHCLRLIFGPRHAIHYSNTRKALTFSHIPEGAIGVSINHVVMIKIYDWWQPLYPFHNADEKPPSNTTDNSAMPEDIFF